MSQQRDPTALPSIQQEAFAGCAPPRHPCLNHSVHDALTAPSLFVIMAHVTNPTNCELFTKALRAVQCFHPGELILVVDNDSPFDNVKAILAEDEFASTPTTVHLMRRSPSFGFLSAWIAADHFLSNAGMNLNIKRLIFLQHSTHLCQVVPPAKPHCKATALAGLVPFSTGGNAQKVADFRFRHSWVSDVAEAKGIACSPPCTTRLPCARGRGNATLKVQQRCLDWGSSTHHSVAFTLAGWERVRRLQLWAREGAEAWGAPTMPGLPRLEETTPSSHAAAAAPVQHDAPNISMANYGSGSERLVGVLLAAVNDDGHMSSDWDACALHPANGDAAHQSHGLLYKVHGGAFKGGTKAIAACGKRPSP